MSDASIVLGYFLIEQLVNAGVSVSEIYGDVQKLESQIPSIH